MKPYLLSDTFKLTDDSAVNGKRYTLIRDLPKEDRPREKMFKYGASSLSTQELLAVILVTGTRNEDVLTMSRRVLKDYGEQGLKGKTDAKTLALELGIPLGKALQIVACAELGRRFYEKNGRPTLRTAKDVFEYLKDMRDLPKEHLRGLYLNQHFKLIHDEVISIGTIDASIIHPREVFRPALEYGAVAVILAHNHPSGSVKASFMDKEVTKELIDAGKIMGVRLLDHVIIAGEEYGSVEAEY
jgi:DNA repair protein RadC